jgi:hypothetical protein
VVKVKPRLGPCLAFLGLALLLASGGVPDAGADDVADALLRLRRALKKGETDERVAALRHVGRLAPAMQPAKRRAAAVIIRKGLEAERDAVVRGAMMHGLAKLGGSTGWIPVVNAWLRGRDEPARKAARQSLLWGGGDYLEVVERLLKEDKDPTFRADLVLLLGDRRRPDAVPLLLAALADDAVRVQAAAAESLEAITGQAFGYDAGLWQAWWEKEGQEALRPPPPDPNAETVTMPEPHEFEEPEPHVTRSLIPDFYGLKITSKDIVFVLDISGSVGATGVVKAKRELIRAVDALGSDVWIAALFFDEKVHMWNPEMVRATPARKAELAHFVRGIKPGKRTDLFTPLNAGLQIVHRRLAAKEEAGEPIREAIAMIVVSDGVETARQTPPAVVADKLDRLDPARTVVHAVALGSRGSLLLYDLARRGGGHYVHGR